MILQPEELTLFPPHSLCENIAIDSPSLFSIAVIKVHSQKLVDERVCLTYICLSESGTEGSQVRNSSNAGVWKQALKQRPGRNVA